MSSNGLDKRCREIVLKNEQGIKWPLVLKHYFKFKSVNSTFLKKGWTRFCKGNRIKAGDSFKFKLVRTWKEPVLSLCPAESNRVKTPLKCLKASEDKNISQHRLQIKKRKYWSRCRASVDNMYDYQTNIGKIFLYEMYSNSVGQDAKLSFSLFSITGNSSRVKKHPRKKVESLSDHSSFEANVTASSLRYDRLVKLDSTF